MARQTRTTVAARTTRSSAPKVPKPPKPMSPTQRKTLATQRIANSLGANANDKDKAITAALEIISERLAHDLEIQQTLRQKYDELKTLGTTSSKPQKLDLGPAPIPLGGGTWDDYKPYGQYDPYRIVRDFGSSQMRAVLLRATPAHLREAVSFVKERNPSTKPTNARSNAGMIDYIMQYVAPGY